MSSISIDLHDLQILNLLQQDGRATNALLGEKIHLSSSQVSRRVQRLEETHVISRYAALLNPEIAGLDVEAYIFVTLGRHGESHGDPFERAVTDMPEVLDCIAVTGECDYILREIGRAHV